MYNKGIIRQIPSDDTSNESQDKLPAEYKSSREIVEAFHQFLKLDGICFLNVARLLQDRYDEIASDPNTKDIIGDNEKFYDLILDWEIDHNELRKLDKKHVDRVVMAFENIWKKSLVLRDNPGSPDNKSPFGGLRIFDYFKDHGDKITYHISRSAFKYFIGLPTEKEAQFVLFDYNVANYLRKYNATRYLYLHGCKIDAVLHKQFDLTVEEIRLALHMDEIKDVNNLREKNIVDIENLEIIKKADYGRFTDFYSTVIENALDELHQAFNNGICPFWLKPQVIERKIHKKGPGAPRKGYALRFHRITANTVIEDAEAVEIKDSSTGKDVEIKKSEKQLKSSPDTQMEISFPDDFPENLQNKLDEVEERLSTILKASNEPHKDEYARDIVDQIKQRILRDPKLNADLIDIVLAWIDFHQLLIQRENKNESDLSGMIQSSLRWQCNLTYKKKAYAGSCPPRWPNPFWKMTIEEEIEELRQQTDFLQDLKVVHGIDDSQVEEFIDEFDSYIKDESKFHKSLDDLTAHFGNWVKGKVTRPKYKYSDRQNRKKQKTNKYGTDANNGFNARDNQELIDRERRLNEYQEAIEEVRRMPRILGRKQPK